MPLADIANIKLLDDRILVQRIDRGEHETQAGIIIPDPAVELGDCAKVIAVGPGSYPKRSKRERERLNGSPRERIPVDFAVGEIVVINRYAGTEITVNDQSYLILRAADVLGSEKEEVAV